MSLEPNSEIVLEIEKPVVGGRMLARHDGQIVLVAGAIPGERVRVRVERVARQTAFANAIEILDPSPDRRGGSVDWACGGSLYAHVAYERQLSLKSAVISDAFARVGKISVGADVPVWPSTEHGYRVRARLHAREGTFGFFREGTHDWCEPSQTGQLLPATIDAIRSLEHTLTSRGISDVTSCEISENVDASERAVLVDLGASQETSLDFETVDGITGLLFANRHTMQSSVAYGSPYVTDRIEVAGASATVIHHVQSFFQGNRFVLGELVRRVLAQVADGPVSELYAGVGLFAVALAARGMSGITAVEGDRFSARDLEANAAPYRPAIDVEQAAVEDYLRRRSIARPETLLLDPPRTGMSREAMSGILGMKPPRIVYVSCDLATLARDVRRFTEAGYRLDHTEAFDLFPNTPHVETLVVLTRPTPD